MCPAERIHGCWSDRELKQDVSLSGKGHINSRPSARHGIIIMTVFSVTIIYPPDA